MNCFRAARLATVFLLLHGLAVAQAKPSKLFFLKDAVKKQWCAFNSEALWSAAVHDTGSMTVATLTYSNDHMSQVDVTETDETGDWTVYDRYFYDESGDIVKLSRLINVLPGDRSFLQTFSISKGKATKKATTAKQLSTGKPATMSHSIWIPELPIATGTKMLPFYPLLVRSDVGTSSKSCR